MKIKQEIDYYVEMGAIVTCVKSLNKQKVEVKFDENGMRITEIGKEDLRTEYYRTSGELRAYLNGLEDGAHGVKDFPDLKNCKTWEQ